MTWDSYIQEYGVNSYDAAQQLNRHIYVRIDVVVDTSLRNLIQGHVDEYVLPYGGKKFWPYVVCRTPVVDTAAPGLLGLGDTVSAVLLGRDVFRAYRNAVLGEPFDEILR